MSSELDDVARCLFNGIIPNNWRRLAPATLKSLGNWMIHFEARFQQYDGWVSCETVKKMPIFDLPKCFISVFSFIHYQKHRKVYNKSSLSSNDNAHISYFLQKYTLKRNALKEMFRI